MTGNVKTRTDATKTLRKMVIPLAAAPDKPLATCVFIAGVRGHPLAFRPVARLIADRHASVGLLHPALAGDSRRLSSIGSVVDLMESAIEKRSVDGPIVFAGYSLGGAYAYELARRVRASGQPAAALLIDTSIPKLRRKRWFRYIRGKALNWVEWFNGPIPENARRPEIDRMVWEQRVLHRNTRPRRSDTPVGLILSRDGGLSEGHSFKNDPDLGWSSVAPVVSNLACSGDHLGLFKPPFETEFASHLETSLRALRSEAAKLSRRGEVAGTLAANDAAPDVRNGQLASGLGE